MKTVNEIRIESIRIINNVITLKANVNNQFIVLIPKSWDSKKNNRTEIKNDRNS